MICKFEGPKTLDKFKGIRTVCQ